MNGRLVGIVSAGIWVVLAAIFSIDMATPGKGETCDACWIIALAGVVGVVAATCATLALMKGNMRRAGLLLVVSVITPTGFAYLPNLIALVAGIVLIVASLRKSDANNRVDSSKTSAWTASLPHLIFSALGRC